MGFIEPVIGGLLIGASTAVLLWGIGRIAGISGILWQSIRGATSAADERWWRILFVIGLVLGPLILVQTGFHSIPASSDASWPLLMVAGLLVGLGTRLGSGCTSGHGVCGISRFSKRSIYATLTFMTTGILTVTIIRHVFA